VSGYVWDPVFRVVPANGIEEVYWLSDRLTDCGGSARIGIAWPEDQELRVDINRDLRAVVNGVRPEVTIDCTILSMDDQAFLAKIVSRLIRPRDFAVYLSLDGGCVERQVVLSKSMSIAPLAGKTVIGAAFSLPLRAKSLIDYYPEMMTDPGVGAELVQDGGVEQWESSSVAQAWAATAGVTLEQETTVVAVGVSSAKFTRPDGGSPYVFQPKVGSTAYRRGVWYRARAKVRGTAVMANAVRLRIFNQTKNVAVDSNGKTWSVNGNLVVQASNASAFDQIDAYFRLPDDYRYGELILSRFQGLWTGGESLYYDDISVYGPVLRPGVATW
jgi:hypothetical protein